MGTVGVALVEMLEHLETEFVFGIPGVHTVELYRGLSTSKIKHITPRHEQGAGFMADGYARASGKPGVCFLITGPGLTNAITAMAQALQDSIPMLVISGVNPVDSLGQGRGLLHELPDQNGLMRALTPHAFRLGSPAELPELLARAFTIFSQERPGPVHFEIPIDLMSAPMPEAVMPQVTARPVQPDAEDLQRAIAAIEASNHPIILAGGGCRGGGAAVLRLAHRLGAPVVSTVNARSALGSDALHVPASASLPVIRDAIAAADLVIGLGTEMGATDYDMYGDGNFPELQRFLRVDIDEAVFERAPKCDVALRGRVQDIIEALTDGVTPRTGTNGQAAAREMRRAVAPQAETTMASDLDILDTVIEIFPESTIVGDSTQLVYSGNLLLRDPLPRGWFNSSTGFGTLGYCPPAAIGAGLARPEAPVICIVGDGGLQFSIAELGTAIEAEVNVIFLVWNNGGYKQIERNMRQNGIEPIGVTPRPPQMSAVASAFGLDFEHAASLKDLRHALERSKHTRNCTLIECLAPENSKDLEQWANKQVSLSPA